MDKGQAGTAGEANMTPLHIIWAFIAIEAIIGLVWHWRQREQ